MSIDYTEAETLDAEIVSDRAGTISMVALFEDILSDAIRNRFVRLSKEEDARILSERGCIGTFAAKIDIGYAIGLYGPKTKGLLHNARRIRNKFAHRHDADSFSNPEIQKICSKFLDFDPAEPGEARSKLNKTLLEVAMRLDSVLSPTDEGRPSPPIALP